jgi:hypothetical protein
VGCDPARSVVSGGGGDGDGDGELNGSSDAETLLIVEDGR